MQGSGSNFFRRVDVSLLCLLRLKNFVKLSVGNLFPQTREISFKPCGIFYVKIAQGNPLLSETRKICLSRPGVCLVLPMHDRRILFVNARNLPMQTRDKVKA